MTVTWIHIGMVLLGAVATALYNRSQQPASPTAPTTPNHPLLNRLLGGQPAQPASSGTPASHPIIDSLGRAKFPDGAQPPSQATQQACQSIYNRLPAVARGIAAPNIQMEIKFAQCMRAHGLPDWPDPDASGNFPLPPDLIAPNKSGPVWARIRTGLDACSAFNPGGSISVSHP